MKPVYNTEQVRVLAHFVTYIVKIETWLSKGA